MSVGLTGAEKARLVQGNYPTSSIERFDGDLRSGELTHRKLDTHLDKHPKVTEPPNYLKLAGLGAGALTGALATVGALKPNGMGATSRLGGLGRGILAGGAGSGGLAAGFGGMVGGGQLAKELGLPEGVGEAAGVAAVGGIGLGVRKLAGPAPTTGSRSLLNMTARELGGAMTFGATYLATMGAGIGLGYGASKLPGGTAASDVLMGAGTLGVLGGIGAMARGGHKKLALGLLGGGALSLVGGMAGRTFDKKPLNFF